MSAHWEQRPPPNVVPDALWRGTPRAAAELTALRVVLLVFEELASNGLCHGRPPVRATVTATATGTGWLLEVSDAAADQPPTPAVGRDPSHGGLGLHLVARLCAGHGWIPRNGRKHVWAHVAPVGIDTAADAG